MIGDAVLDGIIDFISRISEYIPDFSIDNTNIITSIKLVFGKINTLDFMFPITDGLYPILVILITFQLVMLAFWFVNWLLNKIRGAG